MAINPNSAFVRITFDLATPLALDFDEIVKASGRTKKVVLTKVIEDYVRNHKELESKSRVKKVKVS
jgi:hypothetical protein